MPKGISINLGHYSTLGHWNELITTGITFGLSQNQSRAGGN